MDIEVGLNGTVSNIFDTTLILKMSHVKLGVLITKM